MESTGNLLTLARNLRSAAGFTEAAGTTADVVLEVCESAVAASPFAGRARVARALVHVRPGGGYTSFAVRERAAPAASEVIAPSASTFRWIESLRRTVAIDVHLGAVSVFDGERFVETHAASSPAFDSQTTRKGLLERQVTHLLAVPLLLSSGGVAGMIAVEAGARSAMGTAFVWADVVPTLEIMASLAAPYLLALPPPRAPASPTDPLLPVVGESMRSVVETLRVFAQQDETILLCGPTGAGKSRLARWCHARSQRAKKPFEVLDLSANPENLQKGELFGWKRGAFSGATSDNPGAVARAHGGTLFIDEIDKLSLDVQSALLRLLEERKYRSLGDSTGEKTADVRFLVGTNQDLPALVRAGRFREDLYYRIHVLPVRVPPLAERRDEIVEWTEHMIQRRQAGGQTPLPTLSEGARRALQAAPWPGNLRQLDNIVRRACALLLVERPGSAAPPLLEACHVERALAYEGARPPDSFVDLLQAAATAFVLAAEARPPEAPLDLDLTLAIQGFVLGAAVEKTGDTEAAFRLLGRAGLVHHRNHLKVLRRELKKVAEVYAALGVGPSPFEGIGGEGES